MAINNHHTLSEATCSTREWRFKSSLGHKFAGALTTLNIL